MTMTTKTWLAVSAIVAASLWSIDGCGTAGNVRAIVKSETTEPDDDERSLAGLNGVGLVVEGGNPEQAGLSGADIKADAESMLQLSGIRILTKAELLKTPGAPYLYVNVNVVGKRDGMLSYAVSVELNQTVQLTRDQRIMIVGATTWRDGAAGISEASKASDNILDEEGEEIGAFAEAYSAANPKRK